MRLWPGLRKKKPKSYTKDNKLIYKSLNMIAIDVMRWSVWRVSRVDEPWALPKVWHISCRVAIINLCVLILFEIELGLHKSCLKKSCV